MKYIASFCIILGLLSGCKKDNSTLNSNSSDQDVWLVNKEDILNLGTEKDRIQSIDSPVFVPIHDIHLDDDELVLAFHHNGITKVYPLSVMGAHEIINDKIDYYYYSVTFCPLTESALSWNRNINGSVTEFGVSGMLYKDNLIPYDRNTLSNWSQMGNLCINGKMIGFEPETRLLVETTYSVIKNAYPHALILDHESCGDGICGQKNSTEFGDPDSGDPPDLPPGSRYYGVFENQNLLLFEFGLFNDSTRVFQTRFGNLNLLIAGNYEKHFFVAFLYEQEVSGRAFYPVQNDLPIIMRDDTGNEYDLFGNILSGPDHGDRLISPTAYIAHTFAWQALFNNITLYE